MSDFLRKMLELEQANLRWRHTPTPDVAITPDVPAASPAALTTDVLEDGSVLTGNPESPTPDVAVTSPAVIDTDVIATSEVSATPPVVVTTAKIELLENSATSGVSATPDVAGRKRIKQIHHCKLVQDGHSATDQLVYQFLWGAGKPVDPQQPNGRRKISIGLSQMARQLSGVNRRNMTIVVQRLIAKQALVVSRKQVDDEQIPKEYLLFGYDEILERRRQLGMEWVVRAGGGVEFVNPQTGEPLETTPDVARTSGVARTSEPPVIATPDPDVRTTPGGDVAATSLLRKREGREKETTTTDSVPDELWNGLTKLDANIDEGAMRRLWREGRGLIPDLTPEELLFFFEARANMVYKTRGVNNPLGVLLKRIGDWLTSRKVAARREQLRIEEEEMQKLRNEIAEM